MRNYSRPSPAFSCCRWGKAGWGLGMRLDSIYPCANSPSLVRNELKALQVFYFGSGEGRKTFTWLLPRGITVNILMPSLVPRLLCRRGGKRAWYTPFALHQVPLVTFILLHYTNNYSEFQFTCWKAALHSYTHTPCGTQTGGFEVKNNIALTATVCIASFEAIGKLQREIFSVRLRQAQLFFLVPKVCMNNQRTTSPL